MICREGLKIKGIGDAQQKGKLWWKIEKTNMFFFGIADEVYTKRLGTCTKTLF